MKPHSLIITTATALLLGSATLVPAQDRGGDKGGPAAKSERAGGGAAAGRGDGGQGQDRGSRASGRDEGPQKGSAERGGRSAEEKGDRGGEGQRSAREKSGQDTGRDAKEAREKSSREGKDARDRDAKEARDKSGRDGKDARDRDAKEARDKSGRDGKDAKEARDKNERDAKEARDQRERDGREARDRRERDSKEAREGREKDRDAREARERNERDGSAATGAPSDRAGGTGESGRREARDRDRDRIRDVQLTEERRTRVREVFRRQDVRELRDIDFSVSIGTRVPRRIELYPIPAAVIDIVPQYRGYRYFVVHDEIVIVEPDTYEIVYVIDDRGRARAGGGGGACDELALTDDERRLIIRTIEIDRFRDEHGIRVSVGERLPPRLELHEFPDAVIREVSKVRSCRFTVIDGDIAIVDPDERQVVVRVEK
jgi:uncharacterized protein DUF1236